MCSLAFVSRHMDPECSFGKTRPRKERPPMVDVGAGSEFGSGFQGGDRRKGGDSLDDGVEDGGRACGLGCCFRWKCFPGVGTARPRVRVVLLVVEVVAVVLPVAVAGRYSGPGQHPSGDWIHSSAAILPEAFVGGWTCWFDPWFLSETISKQRKGEQQNLIQTNTPHLLHCLICPFGVSHCIRNYCTLLILLTFPFS